MKIWDFLSNKKNQQTLRWIGVTISAIASFIWMIWQHLHESSLIPVAKPEKIPLSAVVAVAPPSSAKPPQPPEATPPPAVQQATAGNGGIAVNALGSSHVDINQHNNR